MQILQIPRFSKKLPQKGLKRKSLEILQINLGKFCNQACAHCHVEAGPNRTEMMSSETAGAVLRFLRDSTLKKIDLTGGAPELIPVFPELVEGACALGIQVIDRCNFTVFFEKGFEHLPQYFKKHRVHVIGSLPCYLRENVDKQRGNGTFKKSIQAIQMLNELGYGMHGSGLILDLVYNPLDDSLPPDQKTLEQEYKTNLKEDFGLRFNHLFAIANMPILRFKHYLERSGKLESYMQLLSEHYNGDTLDYVMCRDQISVDWQGHLYDCDFNQMLEMGLKDKKGHLMSVYHVREEELRNKIIQVGDHCYGCTAGSGSSCGGALL